MNAPSVVSSYSSSSSEEELSSHKRRHSSFSPEPKVTKKSKLPHDVSKWKSLNVQHNLQIFYATKYIQNPSDLIHKITEKVSHLSKEQTDYIDNVNKYLTFNLPLPLFYHQSDLVEIELNKCETVLEGLYNKEHSSLWFLNLRRFVSGLQTLFHDIRHYRKKNQPYEGFFTSFAGCFAELCCLRVQYCNKAHHVVMENLKGVQVSAEPDLRLFKSGLKQIFTETMVSVIEVKTDSYYTPLPHSDKSNEPRPKKYRGSPRSCASSSDNQPSKSTSPKAGSAESSDTEEFPIEADLHDTVLGQHAGELLLDLHDKHKKEDKKDTEDELKKKLTMPGMIVDGTSVFFTLLEMTRKHYQKLRNNENLDEDDRAVIYYSRPKDMLIEPVRRSLISDFMLLNNIEF